MRGIKSVGFLLALLISTTALSAEAPASCPPLQGADKLLEPGKVILLGELHGTRESPAFVGDLACHAIKSGLRTIVGLELLASVQSEVDRFLASPRSAEDRQRLLGGALWQRDYQDGRTSRAMADMIERLAELGAGVVLFDAQPAGGGQAREKAMAANLARSIKAHPEAIHLALSGNLHSRTTVGSRRDAEYKPMGYLLAQQIGGERITALDVSHAGGSAWICGPDCGMVSLGGLGTVTGGTIEIDEKTRPAGHDGWYGVEQLHASPPAVGEYPEVEARVANQPPASSPQPGPEEVFPEQTAELLKPFQGQWQAYQYGAKAWTLDVNRQTFRGVVGADDWYEGKIQLRTDTDPPQIDFLIEDCRCEYRGMVSKGIFRQLEDSIELAAPQPGRSRPTIFNKNDGTMVELKRRARATP